MTKVFDILLDPYHGSQMLRVQLQIGLQKSSKDCKNSFPKILEKNRKKKIHRVGKWYVKPESFICSRNLESRYLEILSLKCCCPDLNLQVSLKWTQALCTTLLALLSKVYKNHLLVLPLMISLEETLLYKSILKLWSLQKRQFFVDEINRGNLVKPSVLVYVMYTFGWYTYLQIMKKYFPQLTRNWKY